MNILIAFLIGLLVGYALRRPRRARTVRVGFEFFDDDQWRPRMNTRITTLEQQTVRAKFKNAAGVEVPVDGIPTWSVDDPSIATITPATDGKSAVITPGAPGTTFVTVTADARIGAGTVPISGQFDVEVIADEAVAVEFEFDPPTPRTPTP